MNIEDIGNPPHIISITATCGRHSHVERALRMFLDQDYRGEHTLLIFNNSEIPQELGFNYLDLRIQYPHKHIILINDYKQYSSLGDIYNQILNYIPEECNIIHHWDDDDIFLPNHLSEGIKGFTEAVSAGKFAYKPEKSYFVDSNGVRLVKNVMEPSIFVDASHVKYFGYSNETTAQHHQWLKPLIEEKLILEKSNGVPTFIYTWLGDVFKTSGDPHNSENFSNYRVYSQDHGDQIITPASSEEVQIFYNLVKNKECQLP